MENLNIFLYYTEDYRYKSCVFIQASPNCLVILNNDTVVLGVKRSTALLLVTASSSDYNMSGMSLQIYLKRFSVLGVWTPPAG